MNDCAEQATEDDDVPQLSAHTLALLQEFYAEQAAMEQCCPVTDVDSTTGHTERIAMPREDWVTYCHLPRICVIITACMAAQGSVKDDFSHKVKTIIFDCLPDPNPVSLA